MGYLLYTTLAMIISRERVNLALQYQKPDRVPFDLGGTSATGLHVDTLYLLRQALKLDKPGTPVKVIEPFQPLSASEPDLPDALCASPRTRTADL